MPAGGTAGSLMVSALSRCRRDTEALGFNPGFALKRRGLILVLLFYAFPGGHQIGLHTRTGLTVIPRGNRGTAAWRREGPMGDTGVEKGKTGRIWHISAAPGSSWHASGGRLRPYG